MLLSGPTTMPVGWTLPENALAVGTLKEVNACVAGLKRQIRLSPTSMNQMLPSGPLTMAFGENLGAVPVGGAKGVTVPPVVTLSSFPLPTMFGRSGSDGFGCESPSAVTQSVLPSG